MNVFLGLMLLAISTFISYILSDKYRKRKDFYKKFTIFNEKLISELNFSKKTLIEMISNLEDNSDFNKFLCKYVRNREIVENINYLNSDEQGFFVNYITTIGNGDVVSQLNFVNSAKIEIEKNLNEAIENDKKYKILYLKIGFLIGLILLVVAM